MIHSRDRTKSFSMGRRNGCFFLLLSPTRPSAAPQRRCALPLRKSSLLQRSSSASYCNQRLGLETASVRPSISGHRAPASASRDESFDCTWRPVSSRRSFDSKDVRVDGLREDETSFIAASTAEIAWNNCAFSSFESSPLTMPSTNTGCRPSKAPGDCCQGESSAIARRMSLPRLSNSAWISVVRSRNSRGAESSSVQRWNQWIWICLASSIWGCTLGRTETGSRPNAAAPCARGQVI